MSGRSLSSKTNTAVAVPKFSNLDLPRPVLMLGVLPPARQSQRYRLSLVQTQTVLEEPQLEERDVLQPLQNNVKPALAPDPSNVDKGTYSSADSAGWVVAQSKKERKQASALKSNLSQHHAALRGKPSVHFDLENEPNPSPMMVCPQIGRPANNNGTQHKVGVHSRLKARDFTAGQIISVPEHVANLDSEAHLKKDKEKLTRTALGAVLSKRRMFVIVCVFGRTLFALPIYSHDNEGLKNKPAFMLEEYVPFPGCAHSPHAPITIEQIAYALSPNSSVYLGAGTTIRFGEDISFVGTLKPPSLTRLTALWRKHFEAAVARS
ncbi:hypothetical protein LTR28_009790 [Elasticomyces elasticus]|nr:hypothetical protein LTR28_009790 [Elasticomyces elasticus]